MLSAQIQLKTKLHINNFTPSASLLFFNKTDQQKKGEGDNFWRCRLSEENQGT